MEVLGWLVYVVCVLGSACVSVWTVVLSQSARARAAMSGVPALPAKAGNSEDTAEQIQEPAENSATNDDTPAESRKEDAVSAAA